MWKSVRLAFIALGAFAGYLFADCTQNGNNITCDNLTSDEVKFEITQNGNVLRGSPALNISGGDFTQKTREFYEI